MNVRTFLFACILVVPLAILTACGSDDGASGDGNISTLEELQHEGKVVVGFANEKTNGYKNDDGELKGASVESTKAVIAELVSEKMQGKIADYRQLVPGWQAGKFCGITSCMAITPDRCENAAFAEPDMKYGEVLIVQKGNRLGLHSYEDIANIP